MKKFLLASLFAIMLSPSYAQLFKIAGHEVGFVYVGPKIGMNFSQISNWSEFAGVENKSRTGFQIGAVGEIGLTSMLSFQGEVTFVSKGMKNTFTGGESQYKVNYLGIPLLAKLSFKAMGLSKIYALGGVYSDVRTGGTYVTEYETGETFEENLSSTGWTRMDWGMMLGAGAEYETKYGIFGLDLRYSQGFVDVHSSDASKNRNRSFGFAVVYKYDLVDLFFRLKNKKNEEAPSE